jgi:hypothetical protein
MKKDTCFNVGPNNIASYIKVDSNKLALKINKRKLETNKALSTYNKIIWQCALLGIHELAIKMDIYIISNTKRERTQQLSKRIHYLLRQ